jgi:hypothetical protein
MRRPGNEPACPSRPSTDEAYNVKAGHASLVFVHALAMI